MIRANYKKVISSLQLILMLFSVINPDFSFQQQQIQAQSNTITYSDQVSKLNSIILLDIQKIIMTILKADAHGEFQSSSSTSIFNQCTVVTFTEPQIPIIPSVPSELELENARDKLPQLKFMISANQNQSIKTSENSNVGIAKNFTNIKHSKPCSIMLYNIIKLKSLDIINENWLWYIPGGIFYSYHFISTKHSMTQEELLEKNTKLNLMHNFAILQGQPPLQEADNVLSVYRIQILSPSRIILLTSDLVGRDSVAFDLIGHIEIKIQMLPAIQYRFKLIISIDISSYFLFSNRWTDYKGTEIIIAATRDLDSEKIARYQENNEEYNHPQIPMFCELFKYLNATIKIEAAIPSVYGTKVSGQWIGMVGLLANDQAHITCPMLMSQYDRFEVMTYSRPLFYDRVLFITKLPTPLRGSPFFLFTPLSPAVWVLMILSVTLVLIGIKISSSVLRAFILYNHPEYFRNEDDFTIYSIAITLDSILKPVIDQSVVDCKLLPIHAKGANMTVRLIFGLWLINLIVVSCAYKSKLISALVNPYYENPPENWHELARSDYGIGGVMYTKGMLENHFQSLENHIGKTVRERVTSYSLLDSDCYTRVLAEEFACMGFSNHLKSLATLFLTDKQGNKLFKLSHDYLFPSSGAIGYSRKFPHLSKSFDRAFGLAIDAGHDIKWGLHAKLFFETQGRRYAGNGGGEEDEGEETNMHEDKDTPKNRMSQIVFFLFGTVCFGFICATIAFILEVLSSKVKKSLPHLFQKDTHATNRNRTSNDSYDSHSIHVTYLPITW